LGGGGGVISPAYSAKIAFRTTLQITIPMHPHSIHSKMKESRYI